MNLQQLFSCAIRHRIARVANRYGDRRSVSVRSDRFRRNRLECLEPRQLLAGDVEVFVENGSVVISGDDTDNGVAIIAGETPNQLVITGVHNNGATTINGQWQEIVDVTGDILINLRDGDDSFFWNAAEGGNVSLPGQLRILGRGGDDRIHLTSIDALFAVHGKTQIDTGIGDDTVSLDAEGFGAGLSFHANLSILTRDGDDQVTVEATGGNASIDVPGKLAIYPGNHGDDVTVAARQGDSAVAVGTLKVSDPHGEDSVTLQAFQDNASLTVNGKLSIATNVGEDVVRLSAFGDNARVALMNDVTVTTGDSEDAVLIEAEYGSATLTAHSDLRVNSGSEADLIRLYANQGDSRVVTRQYVKLDTGDAGLYGGGDYAMILANHDNASISMERNVLMLTGDSLDGENYVLVKASHDNAALDFHRDLTIRVNDSPQFGAVVEVIAGGGNGSGAARISVAENLRVLSGAGAVDVTIAARSDRSTILVGNDLRIFMGGGANKVQLSTSSPTAELIVADDLQLSLGDSDDTLTLTAITILDNAILDGQVGLDTFVDGGGNVIDTLSIINFENLTV